MKDYATMNILSEKRSCVPQLRYPIFVVLQNTLWKKEKILCLNFWYIPAKSMHVTIITVNLSSDSSDIKTDPNFLVICDV